MGHQHGAFRFHVIRRRQGTVSYAASTHPPPHRQYPFSGEVHGATRANGLYSVVKMGIPSVVSSHRRGFFFFGETFLIG